MIYVDYTGELHSKGFYENGWDGVISLPFYAPCVIKCKQADFIAERNSFARERETSKLMVENALKS